MPEKTIGCNPGGKGSDREGTIGLGADLRARREQLGWSLPDVAGWLRIREAYLRALEEGNSSIFPGNAYALGFLRTYAQVLGLDPDQAAARFRQDMRGALDRKPELTFPEPVSERGVPVGLWVGAGLAVLVATYIGYYHFFGADLAPTHRMAPVAEIMPGVTQHGTTSPQIAAVLPDRGLAPSSNMSAQNMTSQVTPSVSSLADTSSSEASAAHTPATNTSVANTSPTSTSVDNPSLADTSLSTEASSAGPEAASSPVRMTDKPLENAEKSASKMPDAGRGFENDGAASHGPVPSLEHDAPSSDVSSVSVPETASAQDEAAPLSGQSASSGAASPVEGTPVGTIVLHAGVDAWVQIRDKSGNLVYSKILKAGENWQGSEEAAPYRMTLGNAGGLTLSAGNVTTAVLGRAGAVRRNLVVTSDAIRRGQIAQESGAATASVSSRNVLATARAQTGVQETARSERVSQPSTPLKSQGESESDWLNARQLEQSVQQR